MGRILRLCCSLPKFYNLRTSCQARGVYCYDALNIHKICLAICVGIDQICLVIDQIHPVVLPLELLDLPSCLLSCLHELRDLSQLCKKVAKLRRAIGCQKMGYISGCNCWIERKESYYILQEKSVLGAEKTVHKTDFSCSLCSQCIHSQVIRYIKNPQQSRLYQHFVEFFALIYVECAVVVCF